MFKFKSVLIFFTIFYLNQNLYAANNRELAGNLTFRDFFKQEFCKASTADKMWTILGLVTFNPDYIPATFFNKSLEPVKPAITSIGLKPDDKKKLSRFGQIFFELPVSLPRNRHRKGDLVLEHRRVKEIKEESRIYPV